MLPDNEALDISGFSNSLAFNRVTNSYKIYWIHGILEEIKRGNKTIKIETIVLWMIVKSWYTLNEYKLFFGRLDRLEEIVTFIYENYEIEKEINEDRLITLLKSIVDEPEIKKRVSYFYKYVPKRFLSSFYSELVGLRDYEKNKLIIKLSNNSSKAIYSLSKYKIIIHDHWYNYFYRNNQIIEGWIKYKLVIFLQGKNPNVPAISSKLIAPVERDLRKSRKYWCKIMTGIKVNDIYTNDILSVDHSFSIDHFIP